MKKALLLSLFYLAGTVFSFAQVKEVKGVTSRIACYDNCEKEDVPERRYGFEYENLNNFAVTIEAEKWRNRFLSTSPNDLLADTKTFILQPGEKYIWKVEIIGYIYGDNQDKLLRKDAYFTKFKAYKNE